MSGFVAILGLRGTQPDPDVATQLVQSLAFRGPDGSQLWTEGPVALGFTLFRTHDGEVMQPCVLGSALRIVAHARLDDRQRLLAELRDAGEVVPDGAPDAQLILHAYRAWKRDCVRHLLGDFSFVVWDEETRRLFCARDPFGTRLMYYAIAGDEVIVGNTLECVRSHPRVSSRLNERAVADFLLFGYNIDLSTTTYADVQRVPPAHSLSVDVSGSTELRRYWEFPEPELLRYRRERDYVDRFVELLTEAVRDRMRTDRLFILMSGGMDSTSIAAIARELARDGDARTSLHALCAYLEHLIDDEEPRYARAAAERIGIPLDVVPIDDYPFFTGFGQGRSDSAICTPEPIDNAGYAILRMMIHRASLHARVAFDGEDGDALFWLPTIREQLRHYSVGEVFGSYLRFALTRGVVPTTGFRIKERLGLVPPPLRPSLPEWMRPEVVERLGLKQRWEDYWDLTTDPGSRRPETKRRLTAAIWQPTLEAFDAGTSGIPLDVRFPFLDLRLVSFVASVPPVPWCFRKELLRVAMKDRLPDLVLRRPKVMPPKLFERRLEQMGRNLPAYPPIHVALEGFVLRSSLEPVPGEPLRVGMGRLRPNLLNFWLHQRC